MLSALTRNARDVRRSSCKSLKQVSCGAAPLTSKVIDDFIQTFPDVDLVHVQSLSLEMTLNNVIILIISITRFAPSLSVEG